MTQNLRWPKASEGGKVAGKEKIRSYWNRQWSQFDSHAEPLAMGNAPFEVLNSLLLGSDQAIAHPEPTALVSLRE
jgi:hypothetical protein